MSEPIDVKVKIVEPGDDAAQFMAHRKAADDDEFIGGLKRQFGI